jgi:hypothetical protein
MYILIGSSALMVTSRMRSRAVITSAMARRGRRLGPVGVGPIGGMRKSSPPLPIP